MSYVGNHRVIKADNANVVGNHNKVTGNNNTITGNHCTVKGDHCEATGNHCTVKGKHNTVNGNYAIVDGTDCAINGTYGILNGESADNSGSVSIGNVSGMSIGVLGNVTGNGCAISGNRNCVVAQSSSGSAAASMHGNVSVSGGGMAVGVNTGTIVSSMSSTSDSGDSQTMSNVCVNGSFINSNAGGIKVNGVHFDSHSPHVAARGGSMHIRGNVGSLTGHSSACKHFKKKKIVYERLSPTSIRFGCMKSVVDGTIILCNGRRLRTTAGSRSLQINSQGVTFSECKKSDIDHWVDELKDVEFSSSDSE